MSVHVMSWVFKHSEESVPGRRLVLLVLADKADDDGTKAFPSVQTIARETRLSERGARYALRALEQAGRIRRLGIHPEYGTHEYAVVMKTGAIAAPPEKNAPGQSGAEAVSQIAPEPSVNPPTPPTREKKKTEDEIPDGFPAELRPHARAAMIALREAAIARGANEVTAAAVGRAVMDHPRKPLVKVARDLRDWLLPGGDGADKQCKNVVKRYRDWLHKEPSLAVTEPLDADGNPTTLTSNVTHLRGRGVQPLANSRDLSERKRFPNEITR